MNKLREYMLNLSIVKKFLYGFLIVLFVFYFLAIGLIETIVYRDTVEKTYNLLNRDIQVYNEHIDTRVDSIKNFCKFFSIDKYAQSELRDYSTLTAAARANNIVMIRNNLQRYNVLFQTGLMPVFLDPGGEIIVDMRQLPMHDVASLDQLKAIDTDLWYVIDDGNKSVVCYVRRMLDFTTGKLLGYIQVFIDETTLERNPDYDGQISFIYDKAQHSIISVSGSMTCAQFASAYQNEIAASLSADNNTLSIDGSDYNVLTDTNEETDWDIVYWIPTSYINIIIMKITAAIILASIVGLIISIIIAVYISKTILNPLVSLTKVMDSINTGNLDRRVQFKGNDEIGVLGKNFNHMMDTIDTLVEDIYNEQSQKKEMEFLMLQAQIKPHFLYNALDSIVSLIRLKMFKGAEETTLSLAKFYRATLGKGKELITLKEELSIAKNYLDIQKTRYQDTLDYSIAYDEALTSMIVPKLMLQPLIENAIYHGIKASNHQGEIKITTEIRDDTIIISVLDNGVGMSAEKLDEVRNKLIDGTGNSYGIYNTHSRVQIEYGQQYGIRIESEQGVFTNVGIIIPKEALDG